jgi:enoyl-[acyl-carrier-protein] reductase (NADH)
MTTPPDLVRAHLGIRGAASYGASKSGLLGLTSDPDRSKRIIDRIPMGHFGQPADIAGTVVYLASPLAAYVTGQVVVVDGGYSADG